MSNKSQKIQKYIIQQTPYGELSEVLKDLDRVSPIDLSSPTMLSTIQEYNQEHLGIAHSGETNFIIMSNNKVGESRYLDQVENKVYTVDHVKLEILNIEEGESQIMEEVSDLLKSLKKDVQSYIDEYYKTPNGVQVFAEISEQGLNVHVGLTSKNISIAKFYTGQWISKWKVNKDEIEGLITIKAHFFQGGNVQFNQKRQLKHEFKFTANMTENSKNIANIIKKFQAQIQESLNVTYDEMPQKFFKKLRRLAPYTKSKMSWNLNAIKMNHNLLQNKKQ